MEKGGDGEGKAGEGYSTWREGRRGRLSLPHQERKC